MNPIFKRVFAILPKQYRAQAVIAGGAAVNLELAKDIDVFVCGITGSTLHEMFVTALTDAKIPSLVFREYPPNLNAKRHIEIIGSTGQIAQAAIYPSNESIECIADIDGGALGLPIQIIATKYSNGIDLLNSFDVSTHAVAFNEQGIQIQIPNTTSLTETPKVLNVHGVIRTLIRYRKICLRYNLAPDPAELVRLCTMKDPDGVDMAITKNV